MKRFFKPIEKDGSSKKPALSPSSDHKPKDEEESAAAADDDDDNNNKREPLKFVTWNANSLLLRVKNNLPELTKFVQTLDPDAICIQVLTFNFFFFVIYLYFG